jgi:hypothetical protein
MRWRPKPQAPNPAIPARYNPKWIVERDSHRKATPHTRSPFRIRRGSIQANSPTPMVRAAQRRLRPASIQPEARDENQRIVGERSPVNIRARAVAQPMRLDGGG